MHIIQPVLFDFDTFIKLPANDRLLIVLEALDAEKLILSLERRHRTGRKGYSVRGMWAALIAGVLCQCRSIAETVRLLERDKTVRAICGFPGRDEVPTEDALGRFVKRVVERQDLLEECLERLVERLRQLLPGFGRKLVVDSTDIKAYANGHRRQPSDPDARWGAKGAGRSPEGEVETGSGEAESRRGKKRDVYYWFGYKLHLLIDPVYELPVTFTVTPANVADTQQMPPLLEKAKLERPGRRPEAVIADKGYDSKSNSDLIYRAYQAAPIIPIIEKPGMQLPDICNAKGTPTCGCGLPMVYWGRDGRYLKYRCPDALGRTKCTDRFRCTPSSYGYVLKLPIGDDARRHPPVPRETKKWERLYRLRSAVERVNSRVKDLLGLRRLTLRRIAKVTVRCAFSLLVMLGSAVGMAQRSRFRELRALVV
jgi:IS5 family transposase